MWLIVLTERNPKGNPEDRNFKGLEQQQVLKGIQSKRTRAVDCPKPRKPREPVEVCLYREIKTKPTSVFSLRKVHGNRN